MGAGRKTETNPSVPPTRKQAKRSKSNTRLEGNSQISIRHLEKDKLGGVIFGCTHETIEECLTKKLFGLTERHWVYVKNVEPGMPLFLFNYSGRKMHGIFEATTSGQFAMDQSAWSGDDRAMTRFPAQVRVSTKIECPPIPENKYKNAINSNYYTLTHFYFELDHAQTEALISVFMTAQSAPAHAIPHKRNHSGRPAPAHAIPHKWDPSGRPAPAPVIRHKQDRSGHTDPAPAIGHKQDRSGRADPAPAIRHKQDRSGRADPDPAPAIGHKQDRSGRADPAPAIRHKQDRSGRAAPARAIPDNQRFSGSPVPVNAVPNKWDLSGSVPSPTAKVHPDRCQVRIESDLKGANQFDVLSHSCDIVPYTLSDQDADYPTESRALNSNLDEQAPDWADLDDDLTKESIESVRDDLQLISPVHDEHHDTMTVGKKFQAMSISQQEVNFTSDKTITQEAHPIAAFPKDPFDATSESNAPAKDSTFFDRHNINDEAHQIVDDLSKKIESLVKKQIVSDQEILSLKESVKNTEKRVRQVEDQFEKLQLKHNSLAALLGRTLDDGEGPSIFLIGGHDGNTWLSSLVSFCSTTDKLESLKPMNSARGCAAVAALKDHFFVFGGWNGSSWYNTVECYNRGNNEWVTCPSLIREKGSLAGATLNNKIFSIGGGNGLQYFSEVEIFDPEIGSWIHGPSMRECRFVPAVAELNGILYVSGGFDGNKYLRSAERYDPREGFWTKLPRMKTKRGSHSVVVLGEALYALGGHHGDRMLSTVEIFDPHANSWRMSSPFSVPRGHACTFTANDNIYLIGGVQLSGECVETVEVYNEKQGWSMPGYKAIGNRSFASAIVL